MKGQEWMGPRALTVVEEERDEIVEYVIVARLQVAVAISQCVRR